MTTELHIALYPLRIFAPPRALAAPNALEISRGDAYLRVMRFQPAIPTRGTEVPSSPDWIHEVKHDGFRLIVVRDGDRVRLLTRNGHDWSKRYPWIVESALKPQPQSWRKRSRLQYRQRLLELTTSAFLVRQVTIY